MSLPYTPRTSFDRTIDLGSVPDTRNFEGAEYAGKHLKVIGQRDSVDHGAPLVFVGCASVTIMGGYFRPTVQNRYGGSDGDGETVPGTLTFVDVGSIHLENVITDNISLQASGSDAICLFGGTADSIFTAQNCHFARVRGGAVFRTASQRMGRTGSVRFYNCTATTDHLGIVTDPKPDGTDHSFYGIGSLLIQRMNIRRDQVSDSKVPLSYLFGTPTDWEERGYPATFEDYWLGGADGETIEDLIWPDTETGAWTIETHPEMAAVVGLDQKGRFAHYPGMDVPGRIVAGRIYQGTPFDGDFVPLDQLADAYDDADVSGTRSMPWSLTATQSAFVNLLRPGGAWITGGAGTITVDSVTGQITIVADGTGLAYCRRGVATVVGKTYQLTWSNENSTLMFRQVGSSEGASDIVPANVSALGDNKREFVATSTTTWVSFQRSTVGSPVVTNVILQEVPDNTTSARRLNAKNQYFALDVQTNLMRMANFNWYIGGFIALTYMPAAGFYIMDFGRLDPGAVAAGSSRVRLFMDSTKIAASTAENSGAAYRENYITTQCQVDTWYYVGVTAMANADVQLRLNTQKATSYTGGVIPATSASDVCRYLQIGARVANPRTGYAPLRYSNWIWCSGWIPTDTQINALANGETAETLDGFTPPAGANLYHWPMSNSTGDEPSLRDPGTLVSNSLYGTPVTVPGPPLEVVVVPVTTPLDIIVV